MVLICSSVGGAPPRSTHRPGRPDVRGNRLAVQAGAAGNGPNAFTAQPPLENFSHFHHPKLPIGHGPSFRRAASPGRPGWRKFQNRWRIVSEKVPVSWGNDSEESQYGLQFQDQRGGKCYVYVARGAEERKSIAWLTLNSERRCVCATSLDRPHVVRGSVFGRDTLEMTAGSLVLNSWRREMRTFALTVGMLMALLVALTLGSNMAQAATTCEMLLDNKDPRTNNMIKFYRLAPDGWCSSSHRGSWPA